MKNITVRRAIEWGLVIMLLASVAISAPQMDQKFAQARQQNAMALRQYTWKSRTEIRKGRDIKSAQMAYMRYDMYGQLQKTPISSTPQQQLPTRGLRGLIAQKNKENFMETMEGLGRLAS